MVKVKKKKKLNKSKNLPVAVKDRKAFTPKEVTRIKIVEYLSNPENEFLRWVDIATDVCGYKKDNQLFEIFTVEERRKITREALDNRRKNLDRQCAAVDNALLKKALSGDRESIELWYARFEGWVKSQKHIFPDENGNPQKIGETKVLNITEARFKEIIHDLNQKV
jgi:hypothetical protein